MNRTRTAAALLAAALAVPLLLVAAPAADAFPDGGGIGSSGDNAGKGYRTDGGTLARAGGHPQGSGAPGIEYMVDWQPNPCQDTDTTDGACVPGLINCPDKPPPDENNDWGLAIVSWRAAGEEQWHALPPECLNRVVIEAPPVTPELAYQAAFSQLHPAPIVLSPDIAGIVYLPEIFSVDQEAVQNFDVDILGHDVHIQSVAESYAWTFGDGGSLSTDTPGRPWVPGTVCTGEADCGGYVHHTYDRASKAGYPVAVTTTWHGSFSVDGSPVFQDIPQRIIVANGPVQLPVKETQVVGGR